MTNIMNIAIYFWHFLQMFAKRSETFRKMFICNETALCDIYNGFKAIKHIYSFNTKY